ncbi:restriction endonuclease subunit S [Proteus columbae]|uniref:restriction endonuclease subunit S n=1 Tax=Proteus columbae TaxID=1987580 RepID=UPI00288AAF6D|nr:restriction endonuclease subunit S [Proteus columbae]
MVPNSISKLDLVQAQISEIPEGWQLCKVSEALRIRNNFRKPISQEVRETMKGQYPYYGPTKIQDYISEYEQDGIYALIGEDGDHFLKYATMPQTQFISGKCTVNNHAHILESSSICDSEWFFNYFKHRNITNFLSRQGAGRFKLNKATLEKLPLLVPPLPEQRKIAQILSTWDKAIATTEKLIATSQQQKKALMQQLLTGKKRLVNPKTGKAFEGDWEEVKLGDVISLGRGFAFKSSQYADSGTKVVRVTNIASSGHIDLSDCVYVPNEITNEYQKYALKNEDILLVMVGATAGKLGFVSENILPSLLNQNMWSLRTRNLDKLNQLFLRHITERIVARYMLTQQGSARGFFTQSTFELVNFQVPSVEEQQKIASVLTSADREIELLEAKLAHLKDEKKALMQQLLTGKRRVQM